MRVGGRRGLGGRGCSTLTSCAPERSPSNPPTFARGCPPPRPPISAQHPQFPFSGMVPPIPPNSPPATSHWPPQPRLRGGPLGGYANCRSGSGESNRPGPLGRETSASKRGSFWGFPVFMPSGPLNARLWCLRPVRGSDLGQNSPKILMIKGPTQRHDITVAPRLSHSTVPAAVYIYLLDAHQPSMAEAGDMTMLVSGRSRRRHPQLGGRAAAWPCPSLPSTSPGTGTGMLAYGRAGSVLPCPNSGDV